jgi:hypothetical protein
MWSGRVSLDQTIEVEYDTERDGEATAHLCVGALPYTFLHWSTTFYLAPIKYDTLMNSTFLTMIISINHYAITPYTLKTKESKICFDYPVIINISTRLNVCSSCYISLVCYRNIFQYIFLTVYFQKISEGLKP